MQGDADQSDLKADFESAKNEMADRLEEGKRTATEALHDARDQITRKASDYAGEAKDALLQRAEGTQRDISANLSALGGALRAASEHLAGADQQTASKFVSDAANGLDRLSSSLKDKPFQDVLGEIRAFGRDNSGALIAGSVLAGLALGRFIKSSAPSSASNGGAQQRGGENGGRNRSETQPGSSDPSEDSYWANQSAPKPSRSDDPNDGWVDTSVEPSL
jgi:F0F1-type ATP synthase membrane subunit b/b'